MLEGYVEFFMKPALAVTYISLRRELEELIQNKVSVIVHQSGMLVALKF